MRHRPVQLGAGPPFSSRHVHFNSTSFTTPPMGAVRREVGYGHCPRCRDADPHPAWNLVADRRSAHCGRDDSRKLFGDSHQAHPQGIAGATCSAICATKLARWGSSGATSAFSALARVGRPPVASSPLPEIACNETPAFSGPAFPLRFKLVLMKRSLRERANNILYNQNVN